MSNDICIQLEEGFDLTPDKLPFYRQCVDWAQRLNRLSKGGVSVRFFEKMMVCPVATVWLKGQELARFYFGGNSISVSLNGIHHDNRKFFDPKKDDAWKIIFKPALKENVREIALKTKEWEEQIDSHTTNRWYKPLETD